ncbi:MAG: Trm112 family protein [Acidobacteriota bacterium]
MPIDKDFLEILACPICKAPFEFREKGGKEQLVCTECRRVYPIEEGIPILLPDSGVLEEG